MDNPNNQKGLILALSSSAFIGSSFIVKKKGLIRARASGNGAGEGGYAYLRESLWWAGLLTMIFGEIANFAAYAFAPAILVTPLGALSVIVSAILAQWLLDERLVLIGKIGCALCILGSTVIVLNAPSEEDVTSVDSVATKMETNLAFQLYAAIVITVCGILIKFVAPKYGKTNLLVYVTICSLVGSLSVIACKGLGLAVVHGELNKGVTWFFAAMVAVSVVTQMNYLNKALDTFNTAMVTPIYYVIFTTFTIMASAILFNGWGEDVPLEPQLVPETGNQNCTMLADAQEYGAGDFITTLCGFCTIVGGVWLLHVSRKHDHFNSTDGTFPSFPDVMEHHVGGDSIAMSDLADPDDDDDDDNDKSQLLQV